MNKKELMIEGIPAILWGEESEKLFVAVHGNMSHKADDVIVILAEAADARGCRVLSFDLPEHGERKNQDYRCSVQNCVRDLDTVMRRARTLSNDISLFACSMGAYFSLLAYRDEPLRECLFLSPVVDMRRIIENMMTCFDVSEDRLRAEKEVATPIGQILYWDYYSCVKSHPIDTWGKTTSILYGSRDDLCESDAVYGFADRFGCDLVVMEEGEHYFHTDEQLRFFRRWLKDRIGI